MSIRSKNGSLPKLTIWYERANERVVLGEWPLTQYAKGLDLVESVVLARSFGFLLIGLSDCIAAELIVDGRELKLDRLGSILVARVALSNDLEFHRIAVLSSPQLARTIDVRVENSYLIDGAPSTKWSLATFEREYSRYSALFSSARQRQVAADIESRGIRIGSNEKIEQVLMQVVGRLATLLASTNASDFLSDFACSEVAELDRERIITALKANSTKLVKSTHGPVMVAGRRYTTDVAYRTLRHGRRVELSAVFALLEACAQSLVHSSCPAAIYAMLREILSEAEHEFPRFATSHVESIESLLTRRMSSASGAQLQANLQLLIAIVQEQIGRDARDTNVLWLRQSIRDFDVFQASAYAAICSAYNYSHEQILASDGVTTGGGVTVLNANTEKGRKAFETVCTGWRAKSLQSSDFHPDAVVIQDGESPVLVDAKFSIPPGSSLAIAPSALKEVQAYLDEFSLPGALMIVPRVSTTSGIATVEGVSAKHGLKRIVAVRLQDSSDTETHAALRRAVASVIELNY